MKVALMRDDKDKGSSVTSLSPSKTRRRGPAAWGFAACAALGLISAGAIGAPAPLAPLPDVDMPNAAKVELGRYMFFEKRLSGNGDRACADCHIPEQGWASSLPLSDGYPGTLHYRNAKTVMNARFGEYFYWDGRLDGGNDLSTQARDSMPDAHFMSADGRIMGQRLKNIPAYVEMFEKAYGGEPYFGLIIKAIGDFEKTLISRNVPFDNYLKGDKSAISGEAKKGLNLFKGNAGCIQCHSGAMLTNSQPYATGVPVNPDIFETKRYVTLRSQQMFLGTPNYYNLREDPGFFAVEKNPKYFATFVTPSLREVSKTPPYMHNGMLPTLEAVVDFYNDGGGDAKNKSSLIKPLGLNAGEKAALIAFLNTLAGDDLGIRTADFTEDKRPEYQVLQWLGKDN